MIKFGIPKKTKEERFYFPVMILHPYGGPKTARKIEFNKPAVESANLDQENARVAFIFGKNNNMLVVNITSLGDSVESYQLTKGNPKTFSDARIYEYILSKYNLNMDNENVFELHPVEEVGDLVDILNIDAIEELFSIEGVDTESVYIATLLNEEDIASTIKSSTDYLKSGSYEHFLNSDLKYHQVHPNTPEESISYNSFRPTGTSKISIKDASIKYITGTDTATNTDHLDPLYDTTTRMENMNVETIPEDDDYPDPNEEIAKIIPKKSSNLPW